jgi:hypothetical protein
MAPAGTLERVFENPPLAVGLAVVPGTEHMTPIKRPAERPSTPAVPGSNIRRYARLPRDPPECGARHRDRDLLVVGNDGGETCQCQAIALPEKQSLRWATRSCGVTHVRLMVGVPLSGHLGCFETLRNRPSTKCRMGYARPDRQPAKCAGIALLNGLRPLAPRG